MTMRQFIKLIANLIVTVDELIQLVVQRRSADTAASIVNMDLYLPLLNHDRHRERLVIHVERCQLDSIQKTCKTEFAVYDVAGVQVFQLLVLHRFQIKLAAIQRRDRRRALYRIGLGTGGQRGQNGKDIYNLIHILSFRGANVQRYIEVEK